MTFKGHKYTFEENLISLILCGLLIVFTLTLRLAVLIGEAYVANKHEPIIWEYVGSNGMPIPPVIEVENKTVEVQPYALTYIAEEPIAGGKLTATLGTFNGPSGKETYYNLPMSGVLQIMRNNGYYMDYSVREDGVKMLGEYVMIAADLDKYPRGTLLETSLGKGIVCDTGEFINTDVCIDIAVDW